MLLLRACPRQAIEDGGSGAHTGHLKCPKLTEYALPGLGEHTGQQGRKAGEPQLRGQKQGVEKRAAVQEQGPMLALTLVGNLGTLLPHQCLQRLV